MLGNKKIILIGLAMLPFSFVYAPRIIDFSREFGIGSERYFFDESSVDRIFGRRLYEMLKSRFLERGSIEDILTYWKTCYSKDNIADFQKDLVFKKLQQEMTAYDNDNRPGTGRLESGALANSSLVLVFINIFMAANLAFTKIVRNYEESLGQGIPSEDFINSARREILEILLQEITRELPVNKEAAPIAIAIANQVPRYYLENKPEAVEVLSPIVKLVLELSLLEIKKINICEV